MDVIEQEFADHIDAENLEQSVLDDGDVMNELFGDEADEAEEAPERQIKMVNVVNEDVTKVKVKRTLLKLDLEKLFSDRGLSAIPRHIQPLKFRGKSHELEDITNICRAYEHWAHRLYPKMRFTDVLEKVEHLGMKNRRKCVRHKAEIYENERRRNEKREDEDEEEEAPTEESVLFGEPTTTTEPDPFDAIINATPQPPTQTKSSLTEEQLERMRQNRLKALKKKSEREAGINYKSHEISISPLARQNVQSPTREQSSDSDCQAPSKRFKHNPDSPSEVHQRMSFSEDDSQRISSSEHPRPDNLEECDVLEMSVQENSEQPNNDDNMQTMNPTSESLELES